MNKERRKQISDACKNLETSAVKMTDAEASVIRSNLEIVSDSIEQLDSAKDDEKQALGALPVALQATGRAAGMKDAIYALGEAVCELQIAYGVIEAYADALENGAEGTPEKLYEDYKEAIVNVEASALVALGAVE